MPLPGLVFQTAPPATAGFTSRADVALFVGLVPRRTATAVPDSIRAALVSGGWAAGPTSAPKTVRSAVEVEALLDVPVPIDGWHVFDALFAWETRRVTASGNAMIPCPMGVAVRSFFAEGGRRCYVVRCGDPLPLMSETAAGSRAARRLLLDWGGAPPPDAAPRRPLLTGLFGLGTPISPTDPRTWHGAAHALGVDEVALLCLPDLPDLLAVDPAPLPPPPGPLAVPEIFVACAPDVSPARPGDITTHPAVTAPRLDRTGYTDWAMALRFVLNLLSAPGPASRRDIMLVAALPLPASGGDAVRAVSERWPLALFSEPGVPGPGASIANPNWLGSGRLQIAYPWVRTALSASLPEGVEGPDGAVTGVIARGALLSGVFASVAGQRLASVLGTVPELLRSDVMRGVPGGQADWLGDRISLVGPRSDGLVMLSDATMADDPLWRAGGVSRLLGTILRGARLLGQDLMFEPSGEALWARARSAVASYLTVLWKLGALDGTNATEAFDVRCDRSTMTQADIDAGRLIVQVIITAAQPVQRLTITLALTGDASGAVAMAQAA